ncbi:hypothetical protein NM688_g2008 [Phlebia brevispora]|uniref:Uncharacterized protein n=1 Tax=Phlebia brevispora TaxID=194682 RepID=A0ACC1T9L1_9APHY|nr:hypothetical protein NM688_g2008 [Phlebia brevispora]
MSTTTPEAGPSGRTSTSDAPHGPIQLFDTHLRFLGDSYLSFFQERKRIEEAYVEALLKLHRRCKTTDIYLNGGHDVPYTTRKAWDEVRDNVEREADTRKAFLESLSVEVINPLIALKDTQERIRKRIREDLKEAVAAHNDYAENVYPKLQRSYLRKAQDAEESKVTVTVPPPLSPSAIYEHNPLAIPKGTGSAPVRPMVTAPQPLRPLDRRPSGSVAPARARSPSTSTALQDLAHQGTITPLGVLSRSLSHSVGKKQLNQLITFLDKGGNIKDTGRGAEALRNVRAKREAEDADKEYRKAVHWLETLRLRRVKILESGYKSLESFVHESAGTMKKVLEHYSDDLTATSVTQTQLCGHARRMVDKINPEQDTAVISNSIPQLLATQTPKPMYYQNYSVGECRDLIFGVSLVDYATAKGLGEGDIPKIVRICIKEIDERGLDAEGLYRVPGRYTSVLELQHKIERNEDEFEFIPSIDDVYVVSALLKLYLRELPEPLFKFPLQDRIQHTEDLESHIANDFRLLRSKLRRLPAIHQATLKALVEHLARVASHSEKNKMDAKNLAIIFGSVVFGEEEVPKGGDLLSVQTWKDSLMEDLIIHANVLFQSNASPPLPPAPAGEPVPSLSYGTVHTRVSEMPVQPRRRTPSPPTRVQDAFVAPALPRSMQGSESHSALTEDFAPQMPARPTNSIHPSLRSGPMSGSPARQSLPPPPRNPQWYDETITYAHINPPVSTNVPSVPSSPSRRPRGPPSPLPPLKSPWSDSQPSVSSGLPPLNLPTSATLDQLSILENAHIISLDEPTSAPSSLTTFASAITPSSSTSSVMRIPPDAAHTAKTDDTRFPQGDVQSFLPELKLP